MARLLIPLVIAVVAVGLVIFGAWSAGQRTAIQRGARVPPDVRALPPSDQETWKLGQEMARLLERGLVDPVERQSNRWEEQARNLVERWHGGP